MSGVLGGLIAAFPTPVTNSYESIATTTLSGGQTTVTFSSIPATFKHLQIRATFRMSASDNFMGRFNSDTGSNYTTHYMYGSGSGPGAYGSTGNIMNMAYTDTTDNQVVWIADILDYASTNKYKTVRRLNGYDANGSGFIYLGSHLWRNQTDAISTITFSINGAASFNNYSHFALYGIKG